MTDIIGATTSAVSLGNSIMSGSYANAGTALGLKIPADNILSSYASYDYIISLSALTVQDFNYPDTSYKAGKVLPLICKTAGASPENRIATAYGKFEFYIDQLTFESIIGLATVKATNVTTIQFDVYEPYSIGTFVLALQTAAYQAKWDNWRDAPFLLTIEFRGNTEKGVMKNVPFAARHIPIRLTSLGMKASEKGCKYSVSAYGTQGQALATQYANLKTDAIIKGTTVQEVLQTGEQSLQAVVNRYLEGKVTDKSVKIADKVVILFPKEENLASKSKPGASGAAGADKKNSATYNPSQVTNDSSAVFKKIGINQTNLIQNTGEVNVLGLSDLSYTAARPGEQASGDETTVIDAASGTWQRGKLVVDPKQGILKFSQDMDIPSVINQVLMQSSYPETALGKLVDGMRTWWRIDTQVFYIDTPENLPITGSYPRIIVYRVVPFLAHASKFPAPGVEVPGFDKIKEQVVKRYDYIYTGKNTEVINFNIDFSVGFANVMAADKFKNNQGVKESANDAKQDNKEDNKPIDPFVAGKPPPTQAGQSQTMNKNTATQLPGDGEGGRPGETEAQRAARVFHKAITNPNDMVVLDLEIWGDPFWIVNSGMGNYTSEPVIGIKDLNKDGSVNWQASEVDMWVYFRSPIDINQVTGLYDFKSPNHQQDMTLSTKAAPSVAFSGLYCVNRVTSTFRQGQFRQNLKGFRRPTLGIKDKATAGNVLGSKNPNTSPPKA